MGIFSCKPKGHGFPGDLLCRAPCEGDRPFAAARFAHLILSFPRKFVFQEVGYNLD
jgi:hypothetical protein